MARALQWIVAAAALALAAGCTSRITAENYALIEDGMSAREVERILGKGDEKVGIGGAVGEMMGSVRVLHWESGDRTITITFLNDRMTTKVGLGL